MDKLKRILHISEYLRDVDFEIWKFIKNLRESDTEIKHFANTRTVIVGDEEHFWMTEQKIKSDGLCGQRINEYIGIPPLGYRNILDQIVRSSIV